ncbi:hypothetical protein ABDK09_03530 [Vibrio sp. CDRSL-10 TSBA]
MKFICADTVAANLPWRALIDKLEFTFRNGVNAPPRHHHTIKRGNADATMLLMPAWEDEGYIGIKMLNVFPANSNAGLPAISGLYLLSEGQHGQTLACIAGNELTRRRNRGRFSPRGPLSGQIRCPHVTDCRHWPSCPDVD